MRIGVVKEKRAGERRVALPPDAVAKLISKLTPKTENGAEPPTVMVERGAGVPASATDDAYEKAGATLVDEGADAWEAQIVVCVNPPAPDDARRLVEGAILIGLLRPTERPELIRVLLERKVSALAFEALPRITRAQKADALSAMSTVAGYRAALLGAEMCPKFFPMLMTAAGTIMPSRVLVIGAGVAGLQAIATARRLGAVVEAYDIRPAAKEQVESLGARFVELPVEATGEAEGGYARQQSAEEQQKQRELLAKHVSDADVVITTALVPGKPAPKLIDEPNVERMRPGAVIVDLAAEAGGNCALTKPDETVEHKGVRIVGPTNLPSDLPAHASQMYGRNVVELILELAPGGDLNLNLDDQMIKGSCITHAGDVLHEPTSEALESTSAGAEG